MRSYKLLTKLFVIAAVLIMIPASGFAIVDASVYGGYSFAGELESGTTKSDVDGYQYGFYGHLNMGIPMLLTVGLGGFYQISPLTIKSNEPGAEDLDATKKTIGLDGYVQLDLPFLPVNPYVRGGIAVKEEIEVEFAAGTWSVSENFKSKYYGGGLCYTMFDAIVWDLQLFVEYLYTTSKQENNVDAKGSAINAGVKMAL